VAKHFHKFNIDGDVTSTPTSEINQIKREKLPAMNNFGVIEIASAKTTSAPGWAYVPDSGRVPTNTAATSNRKRGARNAAAGGGGAPLSHADANARQEAKARREIEILDRDNARDVHIAIPAKKSGGGNSNNKGSGGGGAGGKKHTPNVRKILQSQKTFANHLDDYVALEMANPVHSAGGGAGPSNNNNNVNNETPAAKRAGHRQQTSTTTTTTTTTISTSSKKPQAATTKQEPSEDVEMLDAPPLSSPSSSSTQQQKPPPRRSAILTPYPPPPPHPEDDNPLLVSRLPPLPSDDELRALLAAPPLTYLEARGTWPPQQQYPARVFCVVCGYWGRVRCMKCGTQVCALECLETHREECVTRYGL
jgi:zinc finger HIT domain-containing protein 1